MTVALAAVLFVGGAAEAHDADIVFAQVRRTDGAVVERLTMTPATLWMLAPIDGDRDGVLTEAELVSGVAALKAGVWDQLPLRSTEGPCARSGETARVRETFVELQATFACGSAGGELTQQFRILSVLPSNYKVVLGTYGQGELRSQTFAQGNQQTLTVHGDGAAETGEVAGLGGWVLLGVEHIFMGIDHLAFLLAVLLVGGTWRRILLLVTSFTVAHSVTLGLVTTGALTLSPQAGRWVEVAIAGSIIWIALENLVLKQHRHRAWLTFAFGLVHGFGFASVLAGYGLQDQLAVGLFGFNLGVELGQACVVLAAYPLLRIVSRRAAVQRWTLRLGSGAILAAGSFWMVERLVG